MHFPLQDLSWGILKCWWWWSQDYIKESYTTKPSFHYIDVVSSVSKCPLANVSNSVTNITSCLNADIDIYNRKITTSCKAFNIIIHISCIKKYCTKQGTKVSSITSGLSKFWRKKPNNKDIKNKSCASFLQFVQ